MGTNRESGKQQFEITCASRGFHVYRELWKPKFGQNLQVKQEIGNLHNPFAIFLGAKIPGKLTDFDIVGHIPREISRFCHYLVNYGGKIEAQVRCTKYRPSPIPSGGLEIPILLVIKKGNSTQEIFEKMESFVKSYYLEPDKIVAAAKDKDSDDSDEDFEYVPESEVQESVTSMKCGETSVAVTETQTKVIPETQDVRNTQTIPENNTRHKTILLSLTNIFKRFYVYYIAI